MLKLLLITSLVLVPFEALLAQDEPGAPPPPPIREPMPPKVQEPADGEPEVIIRREDDRVVEEYLVGGRIVMIKVTPFVGPAYYMIDTSGDGNLDMRMDAMQRVKPAQWPIFEW